MNTITAINCINLNIHQNEQYTWLLITMGVNHGREIFIKCSEIFMKLSVVSGSFAIKFAGVSFSLLFTFNLHFFLQAWGQYLSLAATWT